MDVEEYYQQLQFINQMLDQCPQGTERSELLGLKQNIEELLSLATEDDTESPSTENESTIVIEDNQQKNTDMDEEYAMFMAEIAKEEAVESSKDVPTNSKSDSKLPVSNSNLKNLEGTKFRAPHKHQWGQIVYHNAMVCSVPDKVTANDDFQVKVLFLNPTHIEMQPCPYYFHLEKDCNYTEEECKFSHGELVPFSSLQKYIEPKFELLTIGSDVLAKQSNDLWYRAKITQILKKKEKCLVKFDSKNIENQSYEEVMFSHILPLETAENGSDNDSDSESDVEVINNDFERQVELDRWEAKKRHEELINMCLMNVPESQKLGDWEKYTKGIGSKLMQKMGYVMGTGLGKSRSGIVKPVTALILPQGKSLDYCMNLKEERNDPNLFDADPKPGKKKHKTKRLQRQSKLKAMKVMKIEQMDIAKFLEYRYSYKKDTCMQTEEKEFQLMREKLKSGSDKDLNTGNYMVDEIVKRHKKVIDSLKSTIKRLEEVHSDTGKLRKKLLYKEKDLKTLNTYKMMIRNEMDRRKNNKEMAVF